MTSHAIYNPNHGPLVWTPNPESSCTHSRAPQPGRDKQCRPGDFVPTDGLLRAFLHRHPAVEMELLSIHRSHGLISHGR